jgi:prolyl 4-hydroxylase
MRAHQIQLDRAYQLWNGGRAPEALLIFNQLAAKGEPEALFMLGGAAWSGAGGSQDPPRGRELFRRASEAGHADSTTFLTNLLANGVAGPRDWPGAIKRLHREAKGDARRRQALALVETMKLDGEGNPGSAPQGEPLSASPAITLFPRLFTAGECEYLRQLAEPLFAPSTVFDSSRRLVRDPIRTSDGGTIHWLIEDPAVHALNRRLAAATGTSAEQGEAIQILRYRPGQQYHPHLDFVRVSENDRVLTALVYLNHDYAGGETCFVKTGLKVKGRTGDVLVFRNAAPDGGPDPMAEHAGLPVANGTKYLASRWIRAKRWAP